MNYVEEADMFTWSARDYEMRDFMREYGHKLPVIIKVTVGWSMLSASLPDFGADEVYRIHDTVFQKRLLTQTPGGRCMGIPLDYPLRFNVKKKGQKSPDKASPLLALDEIVEKHLMTSDPDLVIYRDKRHGVRRLHFIDQEDRHDAVPLTELTLDHCYEERYLLANLISKGELIPSIDDPVLEEDYFSSHGQSVPASAKGCVSMPTYMPLRVCVATGLTDGTKQDFQKLMRSFAETVKPWDTKRFQFNKEILMYNEYVSGGDYEYITPGMWGAAGGPSTQNTRAEDTAAAETPIGRPTVEKQDSILNQPLPAPPVGANVHHARKALDKIEESPRGKSANRHVSAKVQSFDTSKPPYKSPMQPEKTEPPPPPLPSRASKYVRGSKQQSPRSPPQVPERNEVVPAAVRKAKLAATSPTENPIKHHPSRPLPKVPEGDSKPRKEVAPGAERKAKITAMSPKGIPLSTTSPRGIPQSPSKKSPRESVTNPYALSPTKTPTSPSATPSNEMSTKPTVSPVVKDARSSTESTNSSTRASPKYAAKKRSPQPLVLPSPGIPEPDRDSQDYELVEVKLFPTTKSKPARMSNSTEAGGTESVPLPNPSDLDNLVQEQSPQDAKDGQIASQCAQEATLDGQVVYQGAHVSSQSAQGVSKDANEPSSMRKVASIKPMNAVKPMASSDSPNGQKTSKDEPEKPQKTPVDLSHIPPDISNLSVTELADCLEQLNMGQYSKAFQDNCIDGRFLVSLNDESKMGSMMMDFFGMKQLEAKKLWLFALGEYRPTMKRGTDR